MSDWISDISLKGDVAQEKMCKINNFRIKNQQRSYRIVVLNWISHKYDFAVRILPANTQYAPPPIKPTYRYNPGMKGNPPNDTLPTYWLTHPIDDITAWSERRNASARCRIRAKTRALCLQKFTFGWWVGEDVSPTPSGSATVKHS